MRRTAHLLLATALTACTGGTSDPVTDDALEAALVAVFGEVPDEGSVLVWSTEDPLPAGTTIAPALQEEGEDAAITLDADRRFFFVDEHPFTLFAHDVAYVLVDPDTHDAEVVPASWFPLVDDTLFAAELVYGDPADPGESVYEMEIALPVAPPPAEEPHASVKDGKLNCKDRKNGAVLVTGLLFPDVGSSAEKQDLVPWGKAGMDTLAAALRARGYDVLVVDAETLKAKKSSRAAILEAIAGHAAKQPWERFLVYYVGHGAKDGRLVPHAPGGKGRVEPLAVSEIARAVSGHDIVEVDVAVDACFSGKGAQQVPGFDEEIRPPDLDLHLLAAARANEFALILPRGALLGDTLATWAARLPADAALDLAAFPYTRLAVRMKKETTGSTPTHGDAPSLIPLLEKRAEGGRCVIAGEIDLQAYDRKITLRGRRFGAERGKILLDNGCLDWVEAKVTYWNDGAVTFHAPMGSDGFPATADGAYRNDVAVPDALPCEGGDPAPRGAYRVRVERADGHANHGTGPGSPPVRPWAAPDRVLIRPQLYCLKGIELPHAAYPEGLEWSEHYVPRTPPSDWTQGATTVVAMVTEASTLFLQVPNPAIPFDNGDECTFLHPAMFAGTGWADREETPIVDLGDDWEVAAHGWFTETCREGGLTPPSGDVSYWGWCLHADPPAATGQIGVVVWYE